MNLLDRLKPEFRSKLAREYETYPLSISAIYNDLESKSFWMNLSYDTVCELRSHLSLVDYSPSTISDLFN
jgi:hypothetical protein